MGETTDLELVRAWQAGDAKAGGELFDRHFDVLYRFVASKIGDAADDVVQQTFVACIRGGVGYRGESSFRAYLFAIAKHELYRFVERQARDRPACDPGELSLHDLQTSPSGAIARREDERLLLAALRRLPIEQYLVVELYYLERLRGQDLVAALGIPSGTVRSRLRLALARLRKEIEALAESPEALADTRSTIDRWVAALDRDDDEA